jgi:hypothetical protein
MDCVVTGRRKAVCYKIKPAIADALAEASRKDNRTINNTVETILLGWLTNNGYLENEP